MTLIDRYYRARSRYRHYKRLLFPSPAELKFMRLMGAKTASFKFLKDPATNFPLAIVYRKGKILRRAKLKREVRIGKCYVDFSNDLNWIIEIDGTAWHQDVVADLDREIYMREFLRQQHKDLRILRIPAPRLWHDRARVQRDVIRFLSS